MNHMDESTTRTLIIIRHAKSDWSHELPDLRRPLSPRGLVDAPAVGQWLIQAELAPQITLVSPATRTQQTWALIAAQFPNGPSHSLDLRLYDASWRTMLKVAKSLPLEHSIAAIVGHNPGSHELALSLAGQGSIEADCERLGRKFPTSGVAVLRVQGEWTDLDVASARLTDFVAPRG